MRGSNCSFFLQDPEGNLLPSSSFQDGFFILDLPDGYSGGNYYCLLNLSSTAVGCLPDNSALRDKAMVGVLKQAAPSTGLWLWHWCCHQQVCGFGVGVAINRFVALALVLPSTGLWLWHWCCHQQVGGFGIGVAINRLVALALVLPSTGLWLWH